MKEYSGGTSEDGVYWVRLKEVIGGFPYFHAVSICKPDRLTLYKFWKAKTRLENIVAVMAWNDRFLHEFIKERTFSRQSLNNAKNRANA